MDDDRLRDLAHIVVGFLDGTKKLVIAASQEFGQVVKIVDVTPEENERGNS